MARREGSEPGSVEAATVAAASIAVVRVAVERWRTDESPELLEDRIRESFEAVTRATERSVADVCTDLAIGPAPTGDGPGVPTS